MSHESAASQAHLYVAYLVTEASGIYGKEKVYGSIP
jgi:hypothetical protein